MKYLATVMATFHTSRTDRSFGRGSEGIPSALGAATRGSGPGVVRTLAVELPFRRQPAARNLTAVILVDDVSWPRAVGLVHTDAAICFHAPLRAQILGPTSKRCY